jgi:fructose-1-phosphate kinase PfkB-like protein
MVAALAIALDEELSDEEMLRLATAAAVARISTEGPINCSVDKIDSIATKVVMRAL